MVRSGLLFVICILPLLLLLPGLIVAASFIVPHKHSPTRRTSGSLCVWSHVSTDSPIGYDLTLGIATGPSRLKEIAVHANLIHSVSQSEHHVLVPDLGPKTKNSYSDGGPNRNQVEVTHNPTSIGPHLPSRGNNARSDQSMQGICRAQPLAQRLPSQSTS